MRKWIVFVAVTCLCIFVLGKAYPQDDIESLLTVEVLDESVNPPVVLHTDSLTVSTANNFVDLNEKVVRLGINNPQVSTMRWSASEGADSLFYAIFPPDPGNNVLELGRVPVFVSMAPPINVESFVLFRVSANASAQTDSIRLSLEINGAPVFEDSLFVFEITSLSTAIPRTVPLIKAGQKVNISYESQNFCANVNPAFRDPRNLHTMTFVEGDFTCGASFGNWNSEIDFLAFIARLPEEMPVAVREEQPPVPTQYILKQNYPNPFNPTTTIRYTIAEFHPNLPVKLEIYNLRGQKIRTLVNTKQPAAAYSIPWDGRDDLGIPVASGVYLYRLRAGNFSQVRKMSLIR